MSTPLKTTGTNGDIEQFTVAEQNYLAYQAGLHLSVGGIAEPAGLDFNAGGTTVGTYVNTLMDGAIGSQTLTTSSTTDVSLYQNTGTAAESFQIHDSPIITYLTKSFRSRKAFTIR